MDIAEGMLRVAASKPELKVPRYSFRLVPGRKTPIWIALRLIEVAC